VNDGLTWIGSPIEVFRVVHNLHVDEARHDFPTYLRQTLSGSQRQGGRFNPPGEFGALYTSTDEETAWVEVAARFEREGIDGLPPDMGVLRLVVAAGRYADVTTEDGCAAWDVSRAALADPEPDERDVESCWRLARAVRAVADAIRAPSARGEGANMPLFPDREEGELGLELQAVSHRAVPDRFAQRPNEGW
jgi:RES domain-containing protein